MTTQPRGKGSRIVSRQYINIITKKRATTGNGLKKLWRHLLGIPNGNMITEDRYDFVILNHFERSWNKQKKIKFQT